MKTNTTAPQRRPKLYLPLFLERALRAEQEAASTAFPMTRDQLRRTVAQMVG